MDATAVTTTTAALYCTYRRHENRGLILNDVCLDVYLCTARYNHSVKKNFAACMHTLCPCLPLPLLLPAPLRLPLRACCCVSPRAQMSPWKSFGNFRRHVLQTFREGREVSLFDPRTLVSVSPFAVKLPYKTWLKLMTMFTFGDGYCEYCAYYEYRIAEEKISPPVG